MNTQRLSIALSGSKWPLLALLIAAAWIEPLLVQRSFPRAIEIGGHDLGLAQGWSAKEISDTLPGPNGPVSAVYRWSGPTSSLVFAPAAQRQPYAVTLRLLSGRPGGRAVAPVKLSAGDRPLATFSVGPTLRRYHFLVPGAFVPGGSLILRLDTPIFTPPHDDRVLGLIGLDARMEQAGAATWLPRPTLVLFLLGLAALLFANGRSLQRTMPLVALAAIVPIGLFAPQDTLEAARTLAWLFWIAALIVGGARWWRRTGRRLGHPWRWAAALLLLLTALLFTPGMSADGVEYYAYLRSLAVDHDIEFTDEFKGPEVPFDRVPEWLATNRSPTGYAQNLASVGPAIVWAPFYLVGSLVVRGGNAFGADWTTDGYSLPYIAMINLASVVSLPITVWLCYLIARRYADHGIALLTAISLVAGSAIIDYGLFEAHFPHALAAAAVAAYFAWWLRTRPDRTLRQWVVLGLLAGLMALMYWINAILLLLPALDLLPPFWQALKGGSRTAPTPAIDGSRTPPTRAIGGSRTAPTPTIDGSRTAPTPTIGGSRTPPTRAIGGSRPAPTPTIDGARTAPTRAIDGSRPAPTPTIDDSRTAPTRAIDGARTAPTRAIGGMIGGGLTFLAATLLAFSPQMIAWKILYGSPFTIPHGSSFAEPRGFKALEMLFSPVHGQLLWAPITFVAMIGMGWYIVRRRWEGALVLLAFALYFLYNATLGSWHGGGPFGLRRIANVLPLLTPGLACLLIWLARRGRESPLTLCALCLTWNVALLLRYLGYLIPHHPGELGTLTVGEFVLAPNNLPWYKLPLIVGNALFPRLILQGAGNPAGGEWVPFGLLLGATILIVVATIAALAWLHRRATGAARGGAEYAAEVWRASNV